MELVLAPRPGSGAALLLGACPSDSVTGSRVKAYIAFAWPSHMNRIVSWVPLLSTSAVSAHDFDPGRAVLLARLVAIQSMNGAPRE